MAVWLALALLLLQHADGDGDGSVASRRSYLDDGMHAELSPCHRSSTCVYAFPPSFPYFIYLFLVHLVEELVGGDLFVVYPREGELGSPGKVMLPPPSRWQLLAWLTLPQSPPEHPQDNRGLPRVGYQ